VAGLSLCLQLVGLLLLLADSASRHYQYLVQQDTTLQQDKLLLQGQLICMTAGILMCLAGWLAACLYPNLCLFALPCPACCCHAVMQEGRQLPAGLSSSSSSSRAEQQQQQELSLSGAKVLPATAVVASEAVAAAACAGVNVHYTC